LVNFS